MSVARSQNPRASQSPTPTSNGAIDGSARIDAELEHGDVRLTMGGEPTFVSIDDMDGEEWNYAAVGPEQAGVWRAPAHAPAPALRPGGLLLYGQGKWYPGETLPRWSLGCFWRRDGVPVKER